MNGPLDTLAVFALCNPLVIAGAVLGFCAAMTVLAMLGRRNLRGTSQ